MEKTLFYPWVISARRRSGSLKSPWAIEIMNFLTGEKVTFSKGLSHPDIEIREQRLEEMLTHYQQRLLQGWRPQIRSYKQKRGLSLINMIEELIQDKRSTIRPATFDIYTIAGNRFKQFLQEKQIVNIRPEEFGKTEARRFYNWIASLDSLSGTSKNTYFRTIRTLVNQATGINPWTGFRPFRENVRRHTEYSQEDLARVAAAVREHSLGHFIFMGCIFYLGIRRTELTRLKVENVYPERGLVYIPASVDKNGKEAWIAIPSKWRIELYNYLKGANPLHYLFGSYQAHEKEIRPGPIPKRPDCITQTVGRILERLELDQKGYTLYSAKHTAASRLMKAGTNIYDIKTHLRHSKVETTQKYVRSLGYIGAVTLLENYPTMD